MNDDERPGTEAGPISAGTDPCHDSAATLRQQFVRRRAAAARCVPLECGCRDPLLCRCCTTEQGLSELHLDGWLDAALSILAAGVVPVLPPAVLRALWRRGGRDRVLVEQLRAANGCAP